MTAGRVPDEWVEAAAKAIHGQIVNPVTFWSDWTDQARAAVAAVMPLVADERDRAVRDALDEAAKRIAEADGTHYVDGEYAARIVADLRDGAR